MVYETLDMVNWRGSDYRGREEACYSDIRRTIGWCGEKG